MRFPPFLRLYLRAEVFCDILIAVKKKGVAYEKIQIADRS